MAHNRLNQPTPSAEATQVIELIQSGRSFLLSGGAGSGKTYTLVEIIRGVINLNPYKKIACITYTNSAKEEIIDRVDHQNLEVSTIHEFLWKNIKHFQKELRATLEELASDEAVTSIKMPEGESILAGYYNKLGKHITYKEYVRLRDGVISHDELLTLANKMYEKYPKLSALTKDSYPFIFVDEYQDTSPLVIEILLEHMNSSEKANVVGFFGDSMQSIYDQSIGGLEAYRGEEPGQITEVKKEQNRRNPQLVIDLANELRTDDLVQHPSKDVHAPNMDKDGKIKQGNIKFLYSRDNDIQKVRDYLGWNFTEPSQTRELNLTHNLIAEQAGFQNLIRIYSSDQILAFVRRVKNHIRDNLAEFDTQGKTFRSVLDEVTDVSPTQGMRNYIEEYPETYALALSLNFNQLSRLYVDRDQLVDEKKDVENENQTTGSNRDDLIRHLMRIQDVIWLYLRGDYNLFLKRTDYKITSIEHKKILKENIEKLVNVGEKSIGQVLQEADDFGVVKIDDRLENFKDIKKYIYEQVANIRFAEFQSLYSYLEGHTPFTTQHKTKGSQYDNVLVILDNGRWNNYNFKYLFENEGNPSVIARTQKLFYVCCTRTKESLAVFFHNPTDKVTNRAKLLFGTDNVKCID